MQIPTPQAHGLSLSGLQDSKICVWNITRVISANHQHTVLYLCVPALGHTVVMADGVGDLSLGCWSKLQALSLGRLTHLRSTHCEGSLCWDLLVPRVEIKMTGSSNLDIVTWCLWYLLRSFEKVMNKDPTLIISQLVSVWGHIYASSPFHLVSYSFWSISMYQIVVTSKIFTENLLSSLWKCNQYNFFK